MQLITAMVFFACAFSSQALFIDTFKFPTSWIRNETKLPRSKPGKTEFSLFIDIARALDILNIWKSTYQSIEDIICTVEN